MVACPRFYRSVIFPLAFAILLFVSAPGPTLLSQDDCGGFVSRLTTDRLGQVTPGTANNVRDLPGLDHPVVGRLEAGEIFAIADGPFCVDGYLWWHVETDDLDGYTVEGSGGEYWLEMLPPHTLNYNITHFSLDFTPVVDNVTVHIEPENTTSMEFVGPRPAHLYAGFENPIIDEFVSPRIMVYPVDYFDQYNRMVSHDIQEYNAALRRDAASINWPVMFLPHFNAAMLYASHGQYLEFDGGYGLRFVTEFAQYVAPVNGFDLFYSFQGLSDDGAYYIAAILPVDAAALRAYLDANYDAMFDEVGVVKDEHDRALRALADSLADGDFFPALGTLDDVIRSIRLDGSGQMPPPVTNRYDLNEVHFDYTSVAGDVEIIPDASAFRLSGYPQTANAFIQVETLRDAIEYNPTRLWELQQLLRERPRAREDMTRPILLAPHTTLGNVEYIETGQIVGVRFNFFYPDQNALIVNPIMYAFEGLSKDGRYHVSAALPVRLALLPNSAEEIDADTVRQVTSGDPESYQNYVSIVRALVDGVSQAAFTPCLDGLDALFETMTFDGTAVETFTNVCGP